MKASVTARVRGKGVLVTYTLFNDSDELKKVQIGSYCDAQIGDDDDAPCSFTENGIKMTSKDGTTEFQLIPGGGNFTTRWYGIYSKAYDNVFNNQTDTSTFSEDSGIAWSWTIDIPARATITKTAELSAGQVGTTQIIYDANGGTGEMDPTVDIPGEPIKLNKNTFTKDDYVFQGWDTNSAGTTVVYADEATLTMPDTDTTLYAVWKENPEITAAAEGFEGAYDGKEHGITVTVTDPSSGATIKYGKKAGTYDLDASPTITNVVDSPLTVYFKVTADGYKDYTGSATVTINEQKATYRMVSVTGATHVIGEGTAAVITVKRSENDTLTYKNFAGVSVDGKAVAESNYKKEEGSLVLTLKAAFLDTLSEGDHRVDITFTDGSVETTLRVTTMPGDVPKTGDNFSPAVCFLMLFLAILGIGGVTLSRMKE